MENPVILAPVPPEAPLDMPVQDLRRAPARSRPRQIVRPDVILARLVAFGGGLLIGGIGVWQMSLVFGDSPTFLQSVLLVLFALTFSWTGFSLTTSFAGLFAPEPTNAATSSEARIAILMPVYHENPVETASLLQALSEELVTVGLGHRAEIFVLSDSQRAEAWLSETMVISQLRETSKVPVWYRRRARNTGRKAGNIAEFVRRWGAAYEQMVVLDADSIMSGETIRELSNRLSADPDLGLIQTMPVLVDGVTLFSRLTQFAGRIYGPAVARGVSAWSGDDGNFWGHNAIIRTCAFAESCGLPTLPGKPPFGGDILSHDFVEAALMRRMGWKVRLDHDLRGSFEGCPPTLLDASVRERRWAQGNLQHSRLLLVSGLSWVSRVHFVIGILSFAMSPIWLLMILVGLTLSGVALLSQPNYFPSTYQLFPDWPVFDSARMTWLFVVAMAMLLMPKAVALIRAMNRPLMQRAGGARRLLSSGLFEIMISSLIAPVQMLIQTRQIIEILQGRDSGWEAQVRAGRVPGWALVLRRHIWHVAFGLLVLIVLAYLSPWQLVWLSPILAGLILSPLISRLSASSVIGRWARRRNLLLTPEERDPPAILTAARRSAPQLQPPVSGIAALADPVIRERHVAMLDPVADKTPAAKRLPAVTAAAKIAVAENRAEALEFLSGAELRALLGDAELLQNWADLPA